MVRSVRIKTAEGVKVARELRRTKENFVLNESSKIEEYISELEDMDIKIFERSKEVTPKEREQEFLEIETIRNHCKGGPEKVISLSSFKYRKHEFAITH